MATIKTTGTGSALRVLTKTSDEVQRVSCSCCGCASVPDEITVVFSGLTVCDGGYPAPITTATLTRENPNESHFYEDALQLVTVGCTNAKAIYEAAAVPGAIDLTGYIPEGISPDDTGTPLFSITIFGEDPSTGFGNAFRGLWALKDTPITNFIDFGDCDSSDEWAYGGTATISWE